jgi:hypothetical protein
MTDYVTLIEDCDWEGETWRFYIPVEGNADALGKLAEALAPFADQEPAPFTLDLALLPEFEVDILVKHGGDTDYMAARNKLVGRLVIPDDVLAQLAAGEEEPLYKGSIDDFMVGES